MSLEIYIGFPWFLASDVHHRSMHFGGASKDFNKFKIKSLKSNNTLNDVGHCLSLSAGRYIPPHLRNDASKNGV